MSEYGELWAEIDRQTDEISIRDDTIRELEARVSRLEWQRSEQVDLARIHNKLRGYWHHETAK